MGNRARKLRRRAERALAGGNKELQHRAASQLPILTEAEYLGIEQRIKKQLAPEYAKYFTYQILAVCCKILMEDYGTIHRRKTRLDNFAELYKRGLETLGEHPEIEHYAKEVANWGLDIVWREPDMC